METVSPDLEKQGFFAVVFVNREYSGQPDPFALIFFQGKRGMPKKSFELKQNCGFVVHFLMK